MEEQGKQEEDGADGVQGEMSLERNSDDALPYITRRARTAARAPRKCFVRHLGWCPHGLECPS
jgi:hypothetical protein